jgi:hypothetical protein
MIRPLAVLASAGLVAAALVGCWSRPLTPTRPLGSVEARVGPVAEVGGYLLAPIRDDRGELRFFFPTSAECREVIVAEASVGYQRIGPLGRVSRDGVSCDPMGIASLAEWRDRRPRGSRPLNASAVPREPAFFRVLHSDDEAIFVRGRFLIAREIGWIGDDTVAMLPAACSSQAASGNATVEFRSSGPVAFRLLGQTECPILGFARPVAP